MFPLLCRCGIIISTEMWENLSFKADESSENTVEK